MKKSKVTGIPEHEKSPADLQGEGIIQFEPSTGSWSAPHIESSSDDETDDLYADEDGPQPLDKQFR
ncbi:MAG: hypothetical protein JWL82_584 [Parcubacteria group bacterium]|nr:hypothetical protein [Parcubacteria group bacterium]